MTWLIDLLSNAVIGVMTLIEPRKRAYDPKRERVAMIVLAVVLAAFAALGVFLVVVGDTYLRVVGVVTAAILGACCVASLRALAKHREE